MSGMPGLTGQPQPYQRWQTVGRLPAAASPFQATGMPGHFGTGYPVSWQGKSATDGNATQKSLQKQFPGDYARLAQWTPIPDVVNNARQSWDAMQRISTNTPVKDQQLVVLNDNVKMAGSLLIATLATLGLKQRVFGVGEYLGFLSWFGAMAATPKIINGMVQAKTGVNLNQLYDSTYGQRQNLFKDPHYLPLHILPDEVIHRAADKLGIPAGPNRRQQTEEKMRQISVQTHTWWMLVAGPATPVVSGLVCDVLQNPALRGVNHIKKAWAGLRANLALKAQHSKPEVLAEKTKAYLEQLLGELPESQLSGWWHNFGADIAHKTGLAKAFTPADVTRGERSAMVEKMIAHFEKHPPGDKLMAYLDQQYKPQQGSQDAAGKLEALRAKAQTFLDNAKGKMTQEAFDEQQRLIDRRILNAESTVNHYRSLFNTVRRALAGGKTALGDKERRWVRALIQDSNVNTVQNQLNEGSFKTAARLVGEERIFNKISACLKDSARQFNGASEMMGASPEKHLLDDALKNVKLRGLWRQRMGLMLGGGLLLATGIYSYFFVGKDFDSQSKPSGGATP